MRSRLMERGKTAEPSCAREIEITIGGQQAAANENKADSEDVSAGIDCAEEMPLFAGGKDHQEDSDTADGALLPESTEKRTRKLGRTASVCIIAAAAVLGIAALCMLLLFLLPQRERAIIQPDAYLDNIVVVSLSDGTPGYAAEYYNCNFTFPENEQVIEIADGLMNGSLYVRHTMDAVEYDAAVPDWNIQAGDSPNTFQLYLQALNPVIYLVRACELTGDTAYLERAEQLILSWNEYQSDDSRSKNNTFLWNDHGTAMRAENLIYYYFAAQKHGCLKQETEQLILDMLVRHAQYLYDDSNYTAYHNHGIFQDRALIYTALFLNNENCEIWLDKAKSRLEEQKTYAYTSEMIHVENSPHYHNDVTETFRTIAEFLMQFGDPYGRALYDSVALSTEYMAYILKPDGRLAEIGDTDSSAVSAVDEVQTYWAMHSEEIRFYDLLAWIHGEADYNIAAASAFYPESGYYAYRGEWNWRGSEQSTWSMFRSGYSSVTHKHADDNSFMLYTRGYDVFVDPGYYNYMTGDWHSDYFASSGAHNTVIVDGSSYSPTDENSYLTGIYEYSEGENYDYVLGVNDMYSGVSFDRHYYNLGEAIIIYDDIQSEESHTYSQLFHLSEEAEIISADDESVLVSIGDSGVNVRIRQLGASCELSVINGSDEGAQYGYISRQLNHIDTIDTLKFDQTGDNVSFITLITIESKRGKIDGIKDISFADGVFTVKTSAFDSYTITLGQRTRIDAVNVDIVQNESSFTFTSANSGDGLLFSWEIIRKADAASVYRTEYSEENSFTHDFTQSGEYLVRVYVRDGRLERRAVIADIAFDEPTGAWTDMTADYPHLNLSYYGHSCEHTGGSSYSFAVDFDYSWDYSIRWYIYKNGAYYDTITTYGNTLSYTFEKSGEYTVMYYLRTAGGNNELWNFPAISIDVQE